MNIAIFSIFKPFPPMHGAANRIWFFARALARLGHGVTIIYSANPLNKEFSVQFVDKVKLIEVPFAYKNSFFSFSHWDNELLLFKIFLEEDLISDFDIVQCEFPYLFPIAYLAKLVHKPIVTVSLGVEYDFQREILKAATKRADDLDYLHQGERFSLANSDWVFVCSEVDLKRLKELYGLDERKATIIPNGADADSFEGVVPYDFGRPTVLFVGSPLHSPNKEAIDQLKGEIIPQVALRIRDVLFAFIGKNDTGEPRRSDHVAELGEVEDLRPFLLGSTLCVAPISHGSGTRVKIIEYMAAGRAVVSTSKGAEGLDVVHGENIVIADGLEAFSKAIIDLLEDEKRRRYLGENGRRLVREKYGWKVLCQKALCVYNELAQGRRPNRQDSMFLLRMFNDDYIHPIKKHCLELEAQFKALEGYYSGLENYYRNLQSNYSSLEERHNNLQSNYHLLEEHRNNLQSNYSLLEEHHNSLQSNYSSLEERYNRLQSDYHLLEEHCKNMEWKLNLIKKIPFAKMAWNALKQGKKGLNAARERAARWAKLY